ncbi:MAG TPA: hypothetical protein VLG48_03265 [Candidatus Methylomirabilis sp.]|nr:hypothetical protein [Candidatus Methylomirabilis sp.]
MKNVWIMAAALVFILGAAGYTIAQSTGDAPQSGQSEMMGPGMGMMGGGQGGMMGQGMMGSGMMNMMMGQPLTGDQLKQFADQHGTTVDQAKQMTDQCQQVMGATTNPETTPKQ